MAINRVDKYDYMLLATVNTVVEAKSMIDKIQENEQVIALIDKKLIIKIGGKLYAIPLVEV